MAANWQKVCKAVEQVFACNAPLQGVAQDACLSLWEACNVWDKSATTMYWKHVPAQPGLSSHNIRSASEPA